MIGAQEYLLRKHGSPRARPASQELLKHGGNIQSKACGLGRVGFPQSLPPVAGRLFPFKAKAGALPHPVPDCHLVRTVILCMP